MEHFALYDPLTNLPNRRLLSENLQRSIAQCKRDDKILAVLMLDLDKFKPVNDSFGHRVGDKLLIKVAQRINCLIQRETDTVARIGGDEFVIILPNITNTQDAIKISEKICLALEKSFLIEKNNILISSSVGIAIFPEHGSDEKTLLDNADIAMYQVKDESRVINSYKLFSLK